MSDEPYPDPERVSAGEVKSLVDYFIRTQGHVPSVADVIIMEDALSSVALSRNVEAGSLTLTLDDEVGPVPADVGSDEAAYTAADMNLAWWQGYYMGTKVKSPFS